MKLGNYLLKTEEENRAKSSILLNVSEFYCHNYSNKNAKTKLCCGYKCMLKTCLVEQST